MILLINSWSLFHSEDDNFHTGSGENTGVSIVLETDGEENVMEL